MPIPPEVASGGSTRASSGHCRFRPRGRRPGAASRTKAACTSRTTTPLPTSTSSTPRTAVHWMHPPRILSEHLAPLSEPLACLLAPGAVGAPAAVAAHGTEAPILTHESLSAPSYRPVPPSAARCRLWIIDEAHRFRNPDTNRYRALAKMLVGARVLLVTATPVHNRIADLFHLFRLFLRDHDLTAWGVPSLCRAARGDADPRTVAAAAARLSVSRSRERVHAGYGTGPAVLSFPERAVDEAMRLGAAPDAELHQLVTGIGRLEAGGEAAALFRMLLLSQLASSLPAFRASLDRYEAFLELGVAAAAQGRTLGRRDFRRLFPAGSSELQLAFFPLVLPPGPAAATERDRDMVRRLRALAASPHDPKADALARLPAGAARGPDRSRGLAPWPDRDRYLPPAAVARRRADDGAPPDRKATPASPGRRRPGRARLV